MKAPIQMDELLERVSGNMDFIKLMMNTFFSSYQERLKAMDEAFEAKDYEELADLAHKLKGIVGNLSIKEALELLKKLHVEAHMKNDRQIRKYLDKIRVSIEDALHYFQNDPIFK
jgi:HPt (histidine-containing phosphotransfer) domain-containing protein